MKYINEENFKKVCFECDALLLDKSENEFRQSNSILHVIRDHPVYLKQYNPLFYNGNLKFNLYLFSRLMTHFSKGIIIKLQSILSFVNSKDKLKLAESTAAIFISHYLNDSFKDQDEDFYFSSLPKKFLDKPEKSLLLYINYTSLSHQRINMHFKRSNQNKVVLPKNVSFFKEIDMTLGLLKEAFLLWKSSYNFSGFQKNLRRLAAIESLSSSSHFSLRMKLHLEKFLNITKPKYLFTTYEGHPWERMAYNTAKKNNINIKNIGYQHAVIFKNQHGLQRKLSNLYNPDFILTAGIYGKKILQKTDIVSKDKIFVYGSSRTQLNELNHQPYNPNLINILFLPDGEYHECKLMIDFASFLAIHNVNLNFIIRFHPLIAKNKLLRKNPVLQNKPKNLCISNLSLEEDLKRANHVIFRGSSAVIKAIEFGLYPCYYKIENELSINPLYSIDNFLDKISNQNDFIEVISMKTDKKIENLKIIQTQIKDYFLPLDNDEALKIKKEI